MRFGRLFGRRIVPNLLALFNLPVTCHQSGHIPPPAESLGNQVGRLTFTFSELLGPWSPYDVAQRMPLSSAL